LTELIHFLQEEKDTFLIQQTYASFFSLLSEKSIAAYHTDFLNPWQEYLLELIFKDENPFTLSAEKYSSKISPALLQAAASDLSFLEKIFRLSFKELNNKIEEINGQKVPSIEDFQPFSPLDDRFLPLKDAFLNTSPWENLKETLFDFHRRHGCGSMARYNAFCWKNNVLEGIAEPDPITLEELWGYSEQKKIILENTEYLLHGLPANNILLYGDRGTGKSSLVKALLPRYASLGLRLVEFASEDLASLSPLLDILKQRGLKFILFIDDLSFEENEVEFKKLKALLEGGVEKKPDNVVIYATSNRRHLIKESFEGREAEVHTADSMQEKLSLADRFGITLTFSAPDQNDYLAIVKHLAQKEGLAVPEEELKNLALKWELLHNSRSGRTARQFVDYLHATLSFKNITAGQD
jgi:hypothetical protein